MRATASFGLAGVLAAAGFLYFPAMLFGFPLGGLAAALLIRRRTGSVRQLITATLMAAGGCGLTGLIVVFSLISMQARIDPAWGALAWSFGFGIGGVLSGPALSWLWLPAGARSKKVPLAGLIAGLAFAFSGAIAGYLGFQGFLALHFLALSLCVCLAYLLGGLLGERGWQWSLLRSDANLEEAERYGNVPEAEAAVPASDPERRARNSMVWSITALFLLVFLVVKLRWPMPWADIVLFLAWFVPLMMLGFREVSHQVVFLLVILGAPALLWGIGALLAMRRQPDHMSGQGRRNAVFGTSVGALLVLAGMLLLAPPVTRHFDTLYGRVLLASARASDDWDKGNRIHQANIMMGRSALRGRDLARARSCLLAAGRTPGSPQLDSFGPSMSFAREMLEAGERETVLEYLKRCRSFWKADQGRLDRWTQEIEEGRIPDFGPSL